MPSPTSGCGTRPGGCRWSSRASSASPAGTSRWRRGGWHPGTSGDVEVPVPTDRRGLVTVGPFVLERRAPADLVRSRDLLGEVVDAAGHAPAAPPSTGHPSAADGGTSAGSGASSTAAPTWWRCASTSPVTTCGGCTGPAAPAGRPDGARGRGPGRAAPDRPAGRPGGRVRRRSAGRRVRGGGRRGRLARAGVRPRWRPGAVRDRVGVGGPRRPRRAAGQRRAGRGRRPRRSTR